MQANSLVFRFRYAIHLAIFLLTFTAPWNLIHAIDTRRDTWSWLMAQTTRHTSLNFQNAALLYLGLGIFFALTAALLRTWAAAYLGAAIVRDPAMHGQRVVAAGPFRYVRNPLYIAIFFHALALALLMPPTGALFAIVAIAILDMSLIFGEELFLTTTLGETYLDYKARVPRLIPALTPRTAASNAKPGWGMAFINEVYFWGVAITFIAFGKQFNALPLLRGVLISLGVSIIVRALLPRKQAVNA
jgi:protein-S-isoprenylcysteine O-methyltransferase Ste14